MEGMRMRLASFNLGGCSMDSYRAVALAEGFEEGSHDEIVQAWQYLHDSGLAYKLQGWFGRTVQHLIEEGLINA